jgi:hypothetical protein
MNNHRNNLTSHIVVVLGLDDFVSDPELPAEFLHDPLVGAAEFSSRTPGEPRFMGRSTWTSRMGSKRNLPGTFPSALLPLGGWITSSWRVGRKLPTR